MVCVGRFGTGWSQPLFTVEVEWDKRLLESFKRIKILDYEKGSCLMPNRIALFALRVFVYHNVIAVPCTIDSSSNDNSLFSSTTAAAPASRPFTLDTGPRIERLACIFLVPRTDITDSNNDSLAAMSHGAKDSNGRPNGHLYLWRLTALQDGVQKVCSRTGTFVSNYTRSTI